MSGDAKRRGGLARGTLALCVLFGLLVWPLLLSGRGGTSEAHDQRVYHLPIVHEMLEQWPLIDFVNYKSATSPGYHALLAVVARITGDGELLLRLTNSLFSLLLLLAIYRATARLVPPGLALVLVTPILLSTYFLSGAVWLTTDNAALLWVVLAVGGSVMLAPTPGRTFRWGLYTALAVAIRQIHLWPVAPVALAGLLGSPLGDRLPPALRPHPAPRSWWTLAAAALGAALPVALIGAFSLLWGGLTPPEYRWMHDGGINPATYGFALALFGAFGAFFIPCVPGWWRELRLRDPALWVASAVCVAATVIWPTSFNDDRFVGRWGGALWRLIEITPDIAERSLVLPPLAAVAGVVLVVLYRAADAGGHRRPALILLLTVLGFLLAQSFNTQCFQRFFEVLVLTVLAWLVAMAASDRPPPRWWVGLLCLIAIQLVISLLSVYIPSMT